MKERTRVSSFAITSKRCTNSYLAALVVHRLLGRAAEIIVALCWRVGVDYVRFHWLKGMIGVRWCFHSA